MPRAAVTTTVYKVLFEAETKHAGEQGVEDREVNRHRTIAPVLEGEKDREFCGLRQPVFFGRRCCFLCGGGSGGHFHGRPLPL